MPELYPKINWKKGFEILDKELAQISPDSTETHRRVDILVKFKLKNGKEQWVLLHIEVQGYKDDNFGRRMFIYFYRLIDKFDAPVAMLALLTDPNKNGSRNFLTMIFTGQNVATFLSTSN